MSGGLGGSELAGMSEAELRDVLLLSHTEAAALHALVATGDAAASAQWQQAQAALERPETAAGAEQQEGLEERFTFFMDAVCDRCAYSGYECGCELGEGSPAFDVLRNYERQYTAWREVVRGGGGKGDDGADVHLVNSPSSPSSTLLSSIPPSSIPPSPTPPSPIPAPHYPFTR